MKKKFIGVIFIISFGLCTQSFSCSTSGTKYSKAVSNGITYRCAIDPRAWESALWCDNATCGGRNAGNACYSGGEIYGNNGGCLSTGASYSTDQTSSQT